MTNRQLYFIAGIALALLTIANSMFTVDQRERAVLFQFREIVGADFTPGLHFKVNIFHSHQTAEAFAETAAGQKCGFAHTWLRLSSCNLNQSQLPMSPFG